jgi:hypothetical protein
VPVELEQPVSEGGEPVVVVAVEDDEIVVANAGTRKERCPLRLIGDVPHRMALQVRSPVPTYGGRDVAGVIRGRVDVDLD